MSDETASTPRRQPRSDADRTTTAAMSRSSDRTEAMERPAMDRWSPPNMLETPQEDGEYVFRWVREYVNGQPDARNVQMRLREGFVRVNIAELPESFLGAVEEDVKGDGFARTGGLILMRLPKKFAEQRRAYYRKRSMEAAFAADALQGVAGANAVQEDRGSRSLEGGEAGRMLQQLSQR